MSQAEIYCWRCMEKTSYAIRSITIYRGDALCRDHLMQRLYDERIKPADHLEGET